LLADGASESAPVQPLSIESLLAEPTPAAPIPPMPAAAPAPVEPAAAAPAPAEPKEVIANVDADLDALWPAVLDSIRAEHKLLRAFFNEAQVTSVTDEELVVSFSPSASFNKRKAEEPDNRKILLDTLHRLTGRRYRVFFELSDVEIDAVDAPDRSGLSEDELLERLMSELDAEELPAGQLAQQKGGD
ncbi:MAG TPA: hypothetical protein VFR48_10105, partial [Solirubrobacteraceae bacterium]|nr:hypothetical protein [Solirubrobacteraceae bacterium]